MNKIEWQRVKRREFKRVHGYSTHAHKATGGLRGKVLERDGFSCVKCGMTDAEHKAKWSRPITIDHKDKNRKNNTMENLQTLCLRCHGQKDLIPRLRAQRVSKVRDEIMTLRGLGATYQEIADAAGFSIAAVWKWIQRWNNEGATAND